MSLGANLGPTGYFTTANYYLEDQLLSNTNPERYCNESSPLRYNLPSDFASIGIRRAVSSRSTKEFDSNKHAAHEHCFSFKI